MEQIKCYCGHTTYCDCGPLPKQTIEEAAEDYSGIHGERYEVKGELHFVNTYPDVENAFISGAKWMEDQMEKLKDFDTWKEWKNKLKSE